MSKNRGIRTDIPDKASYSKRANTVEPEDLQNLLKYLLH